MRLQLTLSIFLLGLLRGRWIPHAEGRAMDKEPVDPLQKLSSFKGYDYDFTYGPAGVYAFYYSLPQSSRYEERTSSGEVKGNYAYVAPEGDEFKFKYEAGKKGFQVESNALPIAPEDTEEVKKAKAAFFQAYQDQLALTELEEGFGDKKKKDKVEGDGADDEEEDEEEEDEEESSEEDDDEEDEEDEEESSEEDDDEEDEDDEESSEEDDDEEEEEDEEEEDKEKEGEDKEEKSQSDLAKIKEDDEVRKEIPLKKLSVNHKKATSSSFQVPNYIYKSRPRTSYYEPPLQNVNHAQLTPTYSEPQKIISRPKTSFFEPQKPVRNYRTRARRARKARDSQFLPHLRVQRLS